MTEAKKTLKTMCLSSGKVSEKLPGFRTANYPFKERLNKTIKCHSPSAIWTASIVLKAQQIYMTVNHSRALPFLLLH